jgi:ribonuclease J
MKIRILKGTDEIGGSCIELSTKNTTILLDYGTPLSEDSKKIQIDKKVDAILISHPHQDHFGEIVNIDTKVSIYCGALSLELMNSTKIFTGNKILDNNFQIFEKYIPFDIGDFTITPYLVDHSAVDAYAFLIEADNQKILYSGDFRSNGRKSILFDKMIKNEKLKDIDMLFMEGTMMKRSNDDFPTEQSVEEKIYETTKSNDNLSFMIGSSQNIDSIVSGYRACKRSNKIFVIDIYTAWILECVSKVGSVPNISWKDVKVIKNFGGRYYEKIKENPKYFKDFTHRVFNDTVTLDELKNDPQKYFIKVSPWHIEKLLDKLELIEANIIYSQWLGYLKEEFSDEKTVELFKNLQQKYNWIYAHTSGHADLDTLKLFASSLNPKKLVPIHTEYKEEFTEHFDNVVILEDDELYNINQSLSEYQVNQFNKTFEKELKD